MRFLFRSAIILAVFLPLAGRGVQTYSPEIPDPISETWRWRQVDALNDLGIECMDQAPNGVLWFGGIDSIATYDGIQVKRVLFDEDLLAIISKGPLRPRVSDILVLDDDRVLAIIGRSLVLRKGEVWKVVIPNIGMEHHTSKMQRAEDGSIRLMARKKLWYVSKDLSTTEVVAMAMGNSFFSALSLDPSGRAWLTKLIDGERVELIQIPARSERRKPNQDPHIVHEVPIKRSGGETALAVGQDGRVWYADNKGEGGIYAFNPATNSWEKPIGEQLSPHIFSMTATHDGTIWAGGIGTFYVIRSKGFYAYSRSKLGLLPSVPLKLYEMQNGQYWIIGRVGHVYYLDNSDRHWITYAGLHYEGESQDGTQWFISEDRRIVSHDQKNKSWLRYGPEDGIIEYPRTLTCSSHGLIWVAGQHAGHAAITVFDGEKWTRQECPDFATDMGRWPVMETPASTLYFGAGGQALVGKENVGGILEYGVSEKGTPYLVKHHAWPEIPYYIGSMARSADGTRWLGASAIHRWDAGAERAVPVPGLPGTATMDVIADDEDAIWVAKEGSGLLRKKSGQSSWELQEIRLSAGNVSNLLKLDDGTILAASGDGISRFDGRSWAEGVFSDSFAMVKNGGKMRQASDGALWFNFRSVDLKASRLNRNSDTSYFTTRYRMETFPPDTEIIQYLEQVQPPGNVRITWSGIDPYNQTPSDQLQFSWRFNGGEWSPYSNDPEKTFLGMKSGDYVFEVRARDNDFNVDPVPSVCRFKVIPPVWRQGWFLTLVSTLSVLIIFLFWTIIHNREKHLLEQQAVRENSLMELDRMKTSFFTNISHELNTPISLITEPLKLVLGAEMSDETRSQVSMALRSANRVATLVSQLLDLRKLEQGVIQMNLVEGDLQQQLRECVEPLKQLAQMHQVSLELAGPSEFRGCFDSDKLRKIVQNLVTNAIKYTPPEGYVRVSVTHVESSGAGSFRLMVEDSGIGIEPEHLRHVFDRFYRIPEKSIVDGSGIGLNLAKELVDLWGGTIRVDSPIHDDPERPGSRFTVILPIIQNRDSLSGESDEI